MNKRILLIEDNEQNRYLVAFLMRARGWEVEHGRGRP
jgi:two-component system cell cycle response regulator DivK